MPLLQVLQERRKEEERSQLPVSMMLPVQWCQLVTAGQWAVVLRAVRRWTGAVWVAAVAGDASEEHGDGDHGEGEGSHCDEVEAGGSHVA